MTTVVAAAVVGWFMRLLNRWYWVPTMRLLLVLGVPRTQTVAIPASQISWPSVVAPVVVNMTWPSSEVYRRLVMARLEVLAVVRVAIILTPAAWLFKETVAAVSVMVMLVATGRVLGMPEVAVAVRVVLVCPVW